MSGLQTKKSTIVGIGVEDGERIKNRLLCMPDLKRPMTWDEIDGVRRVVEIKFTSALLDTDLGSTIDLTRVFTYQTSDPFDLILIEDTLTVV